MDAQIIYRWFFAFVLMCSCLIETKASRVHQVDLLSQTRIVVPARKKAQLLLQSSNRHNTKIRFQNKFTPHNRVLSAMCQFKLLPF